MRKFLNVISIAILISEVATYGAEPTSASKDVAYLVQ